MKPIVLVVAGQTVSQIREALELELVRLQSEPPEPVLTFSNISSFSFSEYFSIDKSTEAFEQRTTFQAYLEKLAPTNRHPNPLIILSRAVNVLKLACVRIFQPRWSAARWESTT